MKIKFDHVTNSSSTGFIVYLRKGELESFEEYMANLDRHENAQNEGVRVYMIAKSIEELNDYTNGRPFDWVDKACGLTFDRLSEAHYNLCKGVIEEGGVAVECWVDYNVCEKFDDKFGHAILESFS